MKVSVIIPVYNELDTIAETISRVRASPVDKEIIVDNLLQAALKRHGIVLKTLKDRT